MARPRDASAGFPELLTQARITNRLLAAQLRETMSQQDLVRLLIGTGASNQDIADVLNTTPATVATTLQRLRRKTEGKTGDGTPPLDTGSQE
jgi:DNA-binding CsgD family transcriptional regulator